MLVTTLTKSRTSMTRMAPSRPASGDSQLKSCIAGDPCENFPALRPLIEYLSTLNARVDLKVLTKHLKALRITRADVEPAVVFGKRGYRRNVIAANEWFELLALCWRSGHCTPIHDHQGVSCAFKVIHGEGTEIRFTPTASGLICPAATIAMPTGYVCAAVDSDIHQVANMQAPGQDLVTLHIYSPRIKKMHTYNYATSEGAECGAVYDTSVKVSGKAGAGASPRLRAKRR